MMRGFVLLEILITMLIAGLLSTGLLTTIFQVQRVQQTVNTITSVYGRVAILQNQMEREVMGAFVPAQVDMIQTTTVKKDQPRPLQKIFYSMGKGNGGRLDILTFITANPLTIFVGVKDSKLKPRVARVVYRLLPDKLRKNSYVLMRQEGTTSLDFEKYTPDAQGEFRAFAVIDGIQNLVVRYVTIEQEPSEDQKKMKRVYKKSSEWQSEKKKDDASKTEIQKKEPIRLPHQVEIEISLWDTAFEQTHTFQLIIPIAYKATEVEQSLKKKDEEKKSAADSKSVGT